MPSQTEELKKTIQQQNKKINLLSKRVTEIEDFLEKKHDFKEEQIEEIVEEKVEQTVPSQPLNLFKLFGVVGILMILLGAVYFYKYAVDHEWIGIIGRIVLGVIISFCFLVTGLLLYQNEKYSRFSLFFIAGSLGLLYFTIFATYHFESYRAELGMTLVANTLLLLGIMLGGMLIGIKLDERLIVYGSILLGYIAAFLSGISGNTLHILIYVLLINLVVLIVAKFKSWFIGIPAQVLTYIAYFVWFIQGVFSPNSVLSQTNYPVLVTFIFLFAYYLLFTVISFIQSSDYKEQECLVISLINAICLAGFGLGIMSKYAASFAGLYLIAIAAVTLVVAYLAKEREFNSIFEINFLLVFIFVAIAIPVQFDNTVVSILWVIMALGIAYAGLQIDHEKLFYVGYIGYIIPFIRILIDMVLLDGFNRWLSVSAGLIGLIILQVMIASKFSLKKAQEEIIYNVYSAIGVFLASIWFAREIYAISASLSARHVILSVVWALFAIAMIIYGIMMGRKLFNWMGVILFGIVVVKIIMIDLSSMDNIMRVLALIIVGLLALLGSFIFVKNKEKIKEYM